MLSQSRPRGLLMSMRTCMLCVLQDLVQECATVCGDRTALVADSNNRLSSKLEHVQAAESQYQPVAACTYELRGATL